MNRAFAVVILAVLALGCEGTGSENLGDGVSGKELNFVKPDANEGTDAMAEIGGEGIAPGETSEPDPDTIVDPPCVPGTGCFLDPCEGNGDCLSGWCVEHMGAGVCTTNCQEECPDGWSCKQVAGTGPDTAFICVSNFANLCKPCAMAADCKSVGAADDVCVSYGEDVGSFCGGGCADDECPAGFDCQETTTIDGLPTTQCVNSKGECECTSKSVDLVLWTICELGNDLGICQGKRICAQDGLSACDAPAAIAEECDGVDNDCNGQADDGTCDDGNVCTMDVCNPVQGCTNAPQSGMPCDDGNQCSENDLCQGGICVGVPLACDDDNICTDDLCDPDIGCMNLNNAAPCDNKDLCTAGDMCNNGVCASGPLIDCDDGNPCTADSCDAQLGCVHEDGAFPCDDGDSCTVGDACVDGQCVGAPFNCDDGSLCTADSCNPNSGCDYKPIDCSDDDACTEDWCDANSGCKHDQKSPCCGNGLQEGSEACDDGNTQAGDGCSPTCTIEVQGNCPPPSLDELGHCWIQALSCGESHSAACARINKQATPQSTDIEWSEGAANHLSDGFGCALKKGCCATTMFCSIGPNCQCRVDAYVGTFMNWSNCVDDLPPLYSCYH